MIKPSIKINRTCETCGKKFKVYPSSIENVSSARFCSWECYVKTHKKETHPSWNGGPIEKKCGYCGKFFNVPKYRSTSAKYCSRKCKSDDLIGKFTTTVIRKCLTCGKEFLSKKSRRTKGGHTLYCSIKCSAFDKMGSKHHNWRKCTYRGGYLIEFNAKLKTIIRDRDNNVCAICGKPEHIINKKLAVHHIDYNKNNNLQNNLIALCNKCHIKTTMMERTSWKSILSDIVSSKKFGGFASL